MKYKIDGTNNITTDYPELSEVFAGISDTHIRYILLLYQFNDNQFLKTYRENITDRREKAMEKVGFKPEDKMSVLMGNDELHNTNVLSFVRFLNSKTWMLISALEQRFVEAVELIMKPLVNLDEKSKDLLSSAQLKSRLSDDCDSMLEKLDSYYKTLFGDDVDTAKVLNKKVTSENVFEMLSRGVE